MKKSRRTFLKIAGVSALGLGTGLGAKPVLNAFASSEEHAQTTEVKMINGKDALTAKRWGMVIDTRKIHSAEDLEPVFEVCNKIHNIPHHDNKNHEIKWIWEEKFEHAFPGEYKYLNDRIKHLPFPVLCNHCEDPPCCRACPTKATFKRESDGIVLMDFHRCIGCRFCMAACPFGARSFNFVDPHTALEESDINKEFPTRMKGVVEKCNFCAERLAVGKMPACVEASNGIIAFGDLEDPESEVRKLLKSNYAIQRKSGLGTEPSVYYIV